jgi:hypothetical protein
VRHLDTIFQSHVSQIHSLHDAREGVRPYKKVRAIPCPRTLYHLRLPSLIPILLLLIPSMEQDDRKDHIRIAEEGVHRNEMRSISRRNSSLSIHSARGRVVAPENLLPITYRTL